MNYSNAKKWLTSALAAAGLATLSIFAFVRATPVPVPACNECPPVGSEICCPGSSLTTFQALGYDIQVQSTTDGCFMITSCTPPPPCSPQWQVQLQINRFTGVGYDPNFGNFHWRNNPAMQATSTLTSLTAASQYPAYGQITFYAEAEVDGIPGVFRSTAPVFLENHNVNSFAPFVNELFMMPDGYTVSFINDVTGDEMVVYRLTSMLN